MIESCTRRRMVVLITALLICSCFILLLEEYVEDTDFELAKIIKKVEPTIGSSSGVDKDPKTPERSAPTMKEKPTAKDQGNEQALCSASGEEPTLTRDCERCSAFEIDALQSEHCQETGYFNEWTCRKGNTTKLLPCFTRGSRTRSKFYAFIASSVLSTMVFGAFVRWRKELVERRTMF